MPACLELRRSELSLDRAGTCTVSTILSFFSSFFKRFPKPFFVNSFTILPTFPRLALFFDPVYAAVLFVAG